MPRRPPPLPELSTADAVRIWNDVFRGFSQGEYQTLRVVNRHYVEPSGLVRRKIDVTIVAVADNAARFVWRVPLRQGSKLIGAWPQPAPDVIHALHISDEVDVPGTSARYRDLSFDFTPLQGGQTLTLTFEYVVADYANFARRKWVVLENEVCYAFAYYSTTSTRSLYIFVHLPEAASSYKIEHTFGQPLLFTVEGRAVLGFVDDDNLGHGNQAIRIVVRTKNELAPMVVTGLVALVIALVQISVRGYSAAHALVAIGVATLGAIALRLAVPRRLPRTIKRRANA